MGVRTDNGYAISLATNIDHNQPYYTPLKHTLPVPEIEVRVFFLPML